MSALPRPLKPGAPVKENWREVNNLLADLKSLRSQVAKLEGSVEALKREPGWKDAGGGATDARWS